MIEIRQKIKQKHAKKKDKKSLSIDVKVTNVIQANVKTT